jgi:glutathione S-transferase
VLKLIIGNKNYSSWSLRPWLLLSVHDIPFEEIRVPLYEPDTARALAQYTAAGKVPVLHDGDLVVWDSLAICEYVSEQYLDGGGWPSDAAARAEARSCCAEMHSGFPQLRAQLPMNVRARSRIVAITPELEPEIDRITTLWSGLRKRYGVDGPWLFGGFSAADCMFAPVASRFETYGLPVPDTCRAYMTHVLEQPAMRRWCEAAEKETEVIRDAEVGIDDSE